MMRRLELLPAPEHLIEEGARLGSVAVSESNWHCATDARALWTKHDDPAAVAPVSDWGNRSVLDYEVKTKQRSPVVFAPPALALEEEFGRPEHGPDARSFE